jgi:TPR repeat protein
MPCRRVCLVERADGRVDGDRFMSDKSYLKDLILLRNDPSKVPLIRDRAQKGEMDAQYAMGLIYAEGRGVEIDLAQSHYWLSLAVDQGDRDAELLRNIVGSRMTDAEFVAAKRLRLGPNLSAVRAD